MRSHFRFFPLTFIVIITVTTLCLIPINDPPLQDVPFIDKWTHMVLFGGICGVVMMEMAINRRFSFTWLAPCGAALYGGIIELMQATLTTCRSGEWMDFYADAAGAFIVYPLAYFLFRKFAHRAIS